MYRAKACSPAHINLTAVRLLQSDYCMLIMKLRFLPHHYVVVCCYFAPSVRQNCISILECTSYCTHPGFCKSVGVFLFYFGCFFYSFVQSTETSLFFIKLLQLIVRPRPFLPLSEFIGEKMNKILQSCSGCIVLNNISCLSLFEIMIKKDAELR